MLFESASQHAVLLIVESSFAFFHLLNGQLYTHTDHMMSHLHEANVEVPCGVAPGQVPSDVNVVVSYDSSDDIRG